MEMIIQVVAWLLTVFVSGAIITLSSCYFSKRMQQFLPPDKTLFSRLKMYLIVIITGIIFTRFSFGGISYFIED